GEPGDLLRRRPDIRAAEGQLAAATAQIGIAVADLFPRITLFGSAGYFSTNSSDFGAEASERWSIGPGIQWAAFDLGRVRARIRAEEADADAELATYQKTVLTALEETDNALVRYVQARKREQRLSEAAAASTEAADMARQRYKNGRDTFLTVLDTERRQLEAEDQLAQGRAESVLGLIALYKALGGGWPQSQTPNTQG
ncbi:MAG: TolC family protein, partial [Nevskiales bacterium]